MKLYAIYCPTHLPKALFEELVEQTDKLHQECILKYRFQEDQQRSLLGYLLSIYAIINHCDLRNQDISFSKNKYGKPFLKDHTNIHFNVSHSGSWIVCVINTDIIGVDVEKVTSLTSDISDFNLSPRECAYILSLGNEEQIDGFFDTWVLKESYVKALGIGLCMPLNEFSIVKDSIGYSLDSSADNHFFLKQYAIDDGYKLAVCSKQDNFCQEITLVSIEELVGVLL